MAGITGEELKKRREEFQEQAGQAFDRMLGSDGHNGLVTFQEREDRACELGDELTRLLLEEHLSAEETADPGQTVACPICRQPVVCEHPEQVAMEERAVKTKRGKVQFERAARRCRHCRRVFFPRG